MPHQVRQNDSWKGNVLEDYSSLKGKRVLVRLDWNLPVLNGVPTDTSRADVTFEFIKRLSFSGAKMILMTHFGEKGESISQLMPYLRHHLPFATFLQSHDFDELEEYSKALRDGDALIIENVRMWKGEEDNFPSLARSFARLGEVYINNAFSVSHRSHATVVGLPQLMLSYFGPLFARELEHLSEALAPKKPALLIIGGAKIKTKLSLIERYLDQGVKVFVGGAMVHDLWRARGMGLGTSFHDPNVKLPERIINHPLLVTPVDVTLSSGDIVNPDSIPKTGTVVDCGPETIKKISALINESKTIIANGPIGLYEEGWLKGTESVLVTMSQSEATTYIGGGDTVAVAHSLHLIRKFNFVSLGGGAMLEYLASGTLPGIHAVTESKWTGYR